MGRLFKYLIYLALLAALTVIGYALLFDLPAPQAEISIQIEISND